MSKMYLKVSLVSSLPAEEIHCLHVQKKELFKVNTAHVRLYYLTQWKEDV